MNYQHFLDEFDSYNEWNQLQKKETMLGAEGNDAITFGNYPKFQSNARSIKDDRVNSPSHYTSGKSEVIEIIEDAVKTAPSAIYGMLQAQVLKYMLRVWLKDNPLEDMKKAQWYLTRLIKHYSDPPGDNFPGDWSAPFEKQ